MCHITTVHQVFDARIFHRECKSLEEHGYEVYLIAPHESNEYVEGIHIIALPTKKNRLYRFVIEDFLAFVKAVKVNCEVYHFHDPELIWVGLILKIFRKKVIYDVHENVSLQMLSKYWIPLCLRKLSSSFFRLVESFSIRFFDKVVVAGEDIAKQSCFRRFEDKIEVIKNYPITAVGSYEITLDEFGTVKFIYSGNMNEERGILEIVRAANMLVDFDFKLTLLGRFENKAIEEAVLFRIKNSSKIEYLPAVPYNEMFNILLKYDVGLICFKATPNNIGAISGRNNKIYEYLQAGLAIIASDISGWRGFIEKNKIGLLIDPDNDLSISEAMKKLILDKNLLREMRRNSKELSKEFSWDSQKRKLLEMYEEIIK